MIRGMWRWCKEDRNLSIPYLITLIVFPLPYYLTHSSMDYRQPIEPEIVILVAVGLFGFRNWDGSAHSKVVEGSRPYQPDTEMA